MNKNSNHAHRVILLLLAGFLIVVILGTFLLIRMPMQSAMPPFQDQLNGFTVVPMPMSGEIHFTHPQPSSIGISMLFILFIVLVCGVAFIGGLIYLLVLAIKKSGPASARQIGPAVLPSQVKFCSNCGGDVQEGAYACPKCGFAIRSKRNFCFHCGVKTDPEQVMCVQCGTALSSAASGNIELFGGTKQKLAAALFAILLGSLGVHKFYLESWGWGLIYLMCCWCGLPAILGIIEGILWLTMDDQIFDQRYNQTPPSPFRW